MKEVVAVLGATDHEDRFANRAVKLLKKKGYDVIPVNPLYDVVDELQCRKSLNEIDKNIDTITVYVNPDRVLQYSGDIISAKPRRVILNPGTENSTLEKQLTDAGIEVVYDCTLVLLRTEKF